jgi:hypothetical protein
MMVYRTRWAGKSSFQNRAILTVLAAGRAVAYGCRKEDADSEYDRLLEMVRASYLIIEGNQRFKREFWTYSATGARGVLRVVCGGDELEGQNINGIF